MSLDCPSGLKISKSLDTSLLGKKSSMVPHSYPFWKTFNILKSWNRSLSSFLQKTQHNPGSLWWLLTIATQVGHLFLTFDARIYLKFMPHCALSAPFHACFYIWADKYEFGSKSSGGEMQLVILLWGMLAKSFSRNWRRTIFHLENFWR